MQLINSFTVPAPLEESWRLLNDVERVAPCLPGATLDTFSGDDFTGRVKLKVGAIQLTYRGTGRFLERDEAGHRLVMEASGKEAKGSGSASARVTATLSGDEHTTTVSVVTDLDITGRPAQFGRGIIQDVGGKILGQFAERLEVEIQTPDAPVADAASTADGEPAVLRPRAARQEAEAIDLLAVSGVSRHASAAAGLLAAAVVVLLLLVRRRR